jgi:serine O-acetyltransferase
MRNPFQVRFYISLINTRQFKLARLWGALIGFDLPLRWPTNLVLPHPYGVVINSHAAIGENCVVYQNVTIGSDGEGNVPVIGNDVTIFPGVVIIGKVKIGDNCVIGANSFVNKTFDNNSIIVGSPAKVIAKK